MQKGVSVVVRISHGGRRGHSHLRRWLEMADVGEAFRASSLRSFQRCPFPN